MGKLTRKDLFSPVRVDVIRGYADNNMNIPATSKAIYLSVGTVVYHFTRIKELSGKDPKNFYDLVDLLKMIEEECNE